MLCCVDWKIVTDMSEVHDVFLSSRSASSRRVSCKKTCIFHTHMRMLSLACTHACTCTCSLSLARVRARTHNTTQHNTTQIYRSRKNSVIWTDMIQNTVCIPIFFCRTVVTNFLETYEVAIVMKYADSYNVLIRYFSPYAMPEDPSASDLCAPTKKHDTRFCSQTYF
jgi:hypothetical protein